MARGLRERAFLAPTGHAAVDQLWIAREHDIRPEPEPLHHAGPKTLDQRVGVREQVEHLRDRSLVLQIELDDLAAAHRHALHVLPGADAVERHHLGAHVGQHHAGKRAGTDAGELDDAITGQWTGGADGGVGRGFVQHGFCLECFLGEIVLPEGRTSKRAFAPKSKTARRSCAPLAQSLC